MSSILGVLVLGLLVFLGMIGAAVFFVFRYLAGRSSKWDELAARYPGEDKRGVSTRLVGVMVFDGVRYKRMIKIASLSEGLYMEREAVMGIGGSKPPMFIPWERLKETQNTPTLSILLSDSWRSFDGGGFSLSIPASYLNAHEQ